MTGTGQRTRAARAGGSMATKEAPVEEKSERKPPPRGWSKAGRRRAAAKKKQGRLPGGWAAGDGPEGPAAPGKACGTCGLRDGCDCR